MTRNERRLLLAAVLLGSILLLPLAWWMLPDPLLLQAINNQLAPQRLILQARQLTTAFPFSITSQGATLCTSDDNRPLVTFDRLTVRLQLVPLLLGKVSCSTTGTVGTGQVQGHNVCYPAPKGTLHLRDVALDSLPLVTGALGSGVRGAARLELQYSRKGGSISGEARLKITGLQLQGVKLGMLSLPDLTIPEARGLLMVQGDKLIITSLALQADDSYLRLSGSLPLNPSAPLSLSLELLPATPLLEKNRALFLLMAPYQTAPGAFRLPIGGTITSPQLLGRSGN